MIYSPRYCCTAHMYIGGSLMIQKVKVTDYLASRKPNHLDSVTVSLPSGENEVLKASCFIFLDQIKLRTNILGLILYSKTFHVGDEVVILYNKRTKKIISLHPLKKLA